MPCNEPRRPILMQSPELFDIRGFAEHAVIEFFAARRRPLQELDGAVDGDVFLVAGDQNEIDPFACRRRRRDSPAPPRRCRRCRPSCRRAAPVQEAVLDVAGEGAVVQALSSPGGTTSVCPANVMCGGRVAGCGHRGCRCRRCGFAEGDAMHFEAGGFQDGFEHAERAGVGG